MSLETGHKLAQYEILDAIGAGGMGEVYRAIDTKLRREVAVKVLPAHLSGDADFLARFELEARAVAALSHPNILAIHDLGEQDGTSYAVMELLEGETLRSRLEDGSLTPRKATELMLQIADGLAAAHEKGVIHRDLKPENLFITAEGRVKILDFGLAKVESAFDDGTDSETATRQTSPGTVMGTLGYMSPEQVRGQECDQRSDIFSLGATFYEMLSGVRPFRGDTSADTMSAILKEDTPSISGVSKPLERIASRCLEKKPEERFQTARELKAALDAISDVQDSHPPGSGYAAPFQAREALAIAPAKRTPFVARDQERAQLIAALDDAVEGRGSLVLIGGEPGVGKTRLSEEILLEAQRRELLCFIGHSYEGEGSAPYTPFVETLEYAVRAIPEDVFRQTLGDSAAEIARIMPKLRQIFPDIPPVIELPPDQQRRYLFNSYREFVERGTHVSPLVVLLDDLHWADEPSLQLLEHLSQHLPTQHALIIGTYRDVELEVTRPFAKTLSNLTRQRLAQRIMIRRLTKDSVGELLASLGGPGPPARLAASIFNETEGNPFFVEEVFRDLDEEGKLFDAGGAWLSELDVEQLEVPEGVRLVIGRRLERVGEDVQKVLTAGAVVGRRFGLRILEALGQVAEDALFDALEAAESAQLIHASTEGRDTVYKFSHELIRQTLVGRLSIPRRQRLHLKISRAMEEVHKARLEDHAADYAYHLYQAGAAADPDQTIRFLTLAGEHAIEAAAFEEALEHFELGLTVVEDPVPEQLADLLLKKGSALRGLGDFDGALKAWDQALPLFEEQGASGTVAEICHKAGIINAWLGRPDAWRATVDRGLEAVGQEVSSTRGRLLASSGGVNALTIDPDGGLTMLDDAVRFAEELDDTALRGNALQYKSMALHNHARCTSAIEIGRQGADALRSVNDSWNLVELLAHVEYTSVHAGRLEEARSMSPEVGQLVDELGHPGAAMLDDFTNGIVDYILPGRLSEAVEWSELKIQDWVGPWAQYGRFWMAMSRFLLGDWEEARADAALGTQNFPDENWWTDSFHAVEILIDAYAGTGDPAGTFEQKRDRIPRPGDAAVAGIRAYALIASEALAVIGDREAAASLYPAALDAVEGGFVIWAPTLNRRCVAIAAACGELWDEAEAHFELALTQAHEIPVRTEQPEVRRWYAWMLLDRGRAGDRERAQKLLHEAIPMFEELGMARHLEMAKEML